MHHRIGVIAVFLCSILNAQFSDDFSQGAANTNWIKNPETLEMTFNDGVCSVVNSDEQYSGLAFHSLSEQLSTFTLSGKVTIDKATGAAGFICCLAATGIATGYYVSIVRDELVTVDKVGASGVGTSLVSKRCAYITTSANVLVISKQGSTFNVFCNDQFVATFSDNEYSSGNIAMQVSPKTAAIFDDINLTDTFREGSAPTCFSDDFSNGTFLGWDSFGSDEVTVENRDESMYISTDAGKNTYQVIDLPLVDCTLRALFSHRGGSTGNLYGLFICGESDNTIPVTGFGINGGRNYTVFNAGEENIQLTSNSKIKGAAYIDAQDTTWFIDTLEVIRHSDGSEYLFIINGDTLSRFSNVPYDVTGAGVFCMDSMSIMVDDFLVAQGENGCPVVRYIPTRSRTPRVIIGQKQNSLTCDLLGRVAGRQQFQLRSHNVSGMFITRSGSTASSFLKVR